MVSFDGVVIVTGAGGGGCGRAIAARFAQGGASVVVSDINDPGGEETVRLIQRDRGRAAFFHAESMTPAQHAERGAPATLLSVDQVASAVVHLATDGTLAGRVLVWWSDDPPRFIAWGDRGYEVTDESASAQFRALNA